MYNIYRLPNVYLYTMPYGVYSVQCTQYSIHYTVHTIHYTVYIRTPCFIQVQEIQCTPAMFTVYIENTAKTVCISCNIAIYLVQYR